MGCYRCGERQLEPGRGTEPWRQGVIGDRQVLICPACQGTGDWAADLDKCAACGGNELVRRLGEAECRDCGATGEAVRGAAVTRAGAGDQSLVTAAGATTALAGEVEQALARVLRRAPAPVPSRGGPG